MGRLLPLQASRSGWWLPLLVALACLSAPRTCTASPIYISKGKDGVVTYSSSAPKKSNDAKPHQLPEIMKGRFKAPAPVGQAKECDARNGVACELGADTDGSVICKDGYRDSTPLFRFVCPHPKLELVSLQQQQNSPSALLVIKNTRETTALSPSVRLRSKSGPIISLTGPATLEGGALGVYELVVPKGVLPGGSRKVLKNHLWITCGNCG